MSTQEVIAILITITAAASYLNHKFVQLPKSIGITLVSLSISLVIIVSGKFGIHFDSFSEELLSSLNFDETFLHGMLSFLLFAGAFHVNAMELSKQKALISLLATVSVVISTFLVGYGTYWISNILGLNLPFSYCLVFGALISPTDPIAVMGVLKRVKAPKSLEVKIAGEALFNDGMGIVLFFVALTIASPNKENLTATQISLFFLQQGLGGIILGAVLGWLASKMLCTVEDSDVAIIITLALVTGGYTLAHNIAHVSGPVCMAVAGLIVGNNLKKGIMSKLALQNLDRFWELLDEILNAILFVLIGLEFLKFKFNSSISLISISVIVITVVARWISISIPVASLTRFRKFKHDVIMIMTWGGLRGGISIALALSVQGPYHDIIVSITYAVVLFSMIVQGLTIGSLVKNYNNKYYSYLSANGDSVSGEVSEENLKTSS